MPRNDFPWEHMSHKSISFLSLLMLLQILVNGRGDWKLSTFRMAVEGEKKGIRNLIIDIDVYG